MQFKQNPLIVGTKKTRNISFTFEGKATQDLKNIVVHPACGCTKAVLRVERDGNWVATTTLEAGQDFRITGSLNKLASSGVSTKLIHVSAPNLGKIALKFTIKLV